MEVNFKARNPTGHYDTNLSRDMEIDLMYENTISVLTSIDEEMEIDPCDVENFEIFFNDLIMEIDHAAEEAREIIKMDTTEPLPLYDMRNEMETTHKENFEILCSDAIMEIDYASEDTTDKMEIDAMEQFSGFHTRIDMDITVSHKYVQCGTQMYLTEINTDCQFVTLEFNWTVSD